MESDVSIPDGGLVLAHGQTPDGDKAVPFSLARQDRGRADETSPLILSMMDQLIRSGIIDCKEWSVLRRAHRQLLDDRRDQFILSCLNILRAQPRHDSKTVHEQDDLRNLRQGACCTVLCPFTRDAMDDLLDLMNDEMTCESESNQPKTGPEAPEDAGTVTKLEGVPQPSSSASC